MYYVKGKTTEKEDIEVKDYIEDFSWKSDLIKDSLLVEMAKYVINEIKPSIEGPNDQDWWTSYLSGRFSVKLAYQVLSREGYNVNRLRGSG